MCYCSTSYTAPSLLRTLLVQQCPRYRAGQPGDGDDDDYGCGGGGDDDDGDGDCDGGGGGGHGPRKYDQL